MQEHKGRYLGAFLSEGELELRETGLNALGDTMNGGRIFVHGDAGEAAGYAMWGGALYIRGNAGNWAGTHMRGGATLLIGGSAGAFLGEYQAGGTMIVLGLDGKRPHFGPHSWAGIHGGKIFLRCPINSLDLPQQLTGRAADVEDMESILPHLKAGAARFGWDLEKILASPFSLLTPKSHRPYKAIYTPV